MVLASVSKLISAHSSMRVAPLECGTSSGDHIWECALKSPMTSVDVKGLMSRPMSVSSDEESLMS